MQNQNERNETIISEIFQVQFKTYTQQQPPEINLSQRLLLLCATEADPPTSGSGNVELKDAEKVKPKDAEKVDPKNIAKKHLALLWEVETEENNIQNNLQIQIRTIISEKIFKIENNFCEEK